MARKLIVLSSFLGIGTLDSTHSVQTSAQTFYGHQEGPKLSNITTTTDQLPSVKMFYHIPKTGGSSIRKVMSPKYAKLFPWGSKYSNVGCRIKYGSKFHLTYDEMISCGIAPIPGPSLCIVRDPRARFESEVRWRANYQDHWIGDDPEEYISRMINECEKARRYIKADVFSHCQPQSNYLYKGRYIPKNSLNHFSQMKNNNVDTVPISNQEPVCDYLLSDISKHEKLLRILLGHHVPYENESNRTSHDGHPIPTGPVLWSSVIDTNYPVVNNHQIGGVKLWSKVKEDEIAWIHSFYQSDYEDKAIQLALEGNVLQRTQSGYEILDTAPFV